MYSTLVLTLVLPCLWSDGLSIGPTTTAAGLTVAPIVEANLPSELEVEGLAEAFQKGTVTIVERRQFDPERVIITSKSDRPILFLAGQLLIGGMQDRIVAHDYLLAPKEVTLLNVYCVEEGRSSGSTDLAVAPVIVSTPLRQIVSLEKPDPDALTFYDVQQEIWSLVSRANERAKEQSHGSLRAAIDHTRTDVAVNSIRNQLEGLSEWDHAVGLVYWRGGQLVSFDRFGDHRLLARHCDALLRGLASDTQGIPNATQTGSDPRDLLEESVSGSHRPAFTGPCFMAFWISAPSIVGTAIHLGSSRGSSTTFVHGYDLPRTGADELSASNSADHHERLLAFGDRRR